MQKLKLLQTKCCINFNYRIMTNVHTIFFSSSTNNFLGRPPKAWLATLRLVTLHLSGVIPQVISPFCNWQNVTWLLEYINVFIFYPLAKLWGKNFKGTHCNLHLSEFQRPQSHMYIFNDGFRSRKINKYEK